MGSTLGTNTADIRCIIEDAESVSFHNIHTETQVGFITTIIFHGLGPRHAHERLSQFHAPNLFKQIFGHAFEQIDNIVLLDK